MNFTVNGEQVDLLGEAIQISNLEQIQPGDQVSELFSVKSFSRKFREIDFTKIVNLKRNFVVHFGILMYTKMWVCNKPFL